MTEQDTYDITEDVGLCFESVNNSCIRTISSQSTRIMLYGFIGLMCVLTVCGNLLVISSILHFKQLHTPTNYLILSLAVSDLLLGAVVMPPSMVHSIEKCWYFGDVLCKFRSSADITLCNTSILTLSFISIDRYYAVCQPLRYRGKITVNTVMVMILFSWTLSALVGFGMIFLKLDKLGMEDSYLDHFACEGGCFFFQTPTASTITVILSYYLPAVLMLSIYLKVLLVAHRQARSINNTACQSVRQGTSVSKRERKATKTLAIVVGVYITCWTPIFLLVLMDPFIGHSTPMIVIEIFLWFSYFNSTFNPLIYAFFYSWFRKAFRMIVSGRIFQNGSSTTLLMTD